MAREGESPRRDTTAPTRRGWVVLGVVAAVAFGAGMTAGLRLRSVPPTTGPIALPIASGLRGPPSSPSPDASPGVAAPPAVASAEVVERAAKGDLDALRRLELVPAAERDVTGSIALARGHTQLRRRAIRSLEGDLSRDPKLLGDASTLSRLHGLGRDPELYIDALPAIARLPGALGPDMLFDLAEQAPEGSNARLLAEDLLRDPDVAERAQPPLKALLALRSSRACHRVRAMVQDVLAEGDERSLPVLEALRARSGCGSDGAQDCYGCLRDDDLLGRAMDAVKARKAPRPWTFER